MRVAIIAITEKGTRLGERLGAKLNAETVLYSRARCSLQAATYPFDRLAELVDQIFTEYDGLVFIMATGIAVRVLAPHIHEKRPYPAVVVMDDAGIHAISLFSRHIGGANELTGQVAAAVGATPVITTVATEANLPAPDVVAVKLDLTIDPFEEMKAVNAAIVNGQKVPFFIDRDILNAGKYFDWAAEAGVELSGLEGLQHYDDYEAAVIISDKVLYIPHLHVYLRPTTLAVGLDCRQDATSSEMLAAIHDACNAVSRSPKSIAVLTSGASRQEAIGLLAVAQQMETPLFFYDDAQLQAATAASDKKSQQEREQAVASMAGAAALLGAQTNKLLLKASAYPMVTVAIAEVTSRWWESSPAAATA